MFLVVDAPRKMVDAPDAPCAAAAFGCLAHIEHARGAAETVADDAVLFPESLKPEDVGDETLRHFGIALPHLRAVEAAYLPLLRNAAAVPWRKAAGRRLAWLDERHLEPMRIDQRQQTVAKAM